MANPVHQDLLDRFILDTASMSRDELAPIWRDATNPEVWESPLYEGLLRAIRDVNVRAVFGLGDQPDYVLIANSRWAQVPVDNMLIPALSRFTFGQVYDAIVYHGNVPDSVVGADVAAFKAAMGPELDRRARILADAVKLRQLRRP